MAGPGAGPCACATEGARASWQLPTATPAERAGTTHLSTHLLPTRRPRCWQLRRQSHASRNPPRSRAGVRGPAPGPRIGHRGSPGYPRPRSTSEWTARHWVAAPRGRRWWCALKTAREIELQASRTTGQGGRRGRVRGAGMTACTQGFSPHKPSQAKLQRELGILSHQTHGSQHRLRSPRVVAGLGRFGAPVHGRPTALEKSCCWLRFPRRPLPSHSPGPRQGNRRQAVQETARTGAPRRGAPTRGRRGGGRGPRGRPCGHR